MDFDTAYALAKRIRDETGHTLIIENVGLEPGGRYVKMRDTTRGGTYYFYSPEAWEDEKRKQGWAEQMQWRPQPGGWQE